MWHKRLCNCLGLWLKPRAAFLAVTDALPYQELYSSIWWQHNCSLPGTWHVGFDAQPPHAVQVAPTALPLPKTTPRIVPALSGRNGQAAQPPSQRATWRRSQQQ
jgi:hypothetical protein